MEQNLRRDGVLKYGDADGLYIWQAAGSEQVYSFHITDFVPNL